MGENTIIDPYHIPLVRNELTKNIRTILPDVHDELEHCFSEILPPTEGGFLQLELSTTSTNYGCRLGLCFSHG
jgi:hypothetical protein